VGKAGQDYIRGWDKNDEERITGQTETEEFTPEKRESALDYLNADDLIDE